MAIKKGGLGRGISALLPQSQSQYEQLNSKDTVQEVLTNLIQPNRYQPRREFDETALNELAESIKSYGILQPLIVRSLDTGGYELIAGERRLRASKIVGLENVPVIIRDYTDAQMSEISIIENVQRENLNVIEEAQAYDRLIKEFGHTQEVVAAKIGRSRSHISNMLRLLKLCPTVRTLIAKGILTLGQARPLLAIENEAIQIQAAEMILSEGLSARKVEAFVNELKNSGLLDTLTANLNATPDQTPAKPSNPVTPTSTPTPTHSQTPALTPTVEVNNKTVDTTPTSDKINVAHSEQNKPKSISKPNNRAATDSSSIFIHEVEIKLSSILGAKVKIVNSKKSCRLQIDFSSIQELSHFIETLDGSAASDNTQNKAPLSTKEEKIEALRKFSTSQGFTI